MVMKFKNIVVLLVATVIFSSCTSQNKQIGMPDYYDNDNSTNCFFDNTPINNFQLPNIIVDGEVYNPGKVDFSKLIIHEMVVKETLLENGEDKFIGAYRYVGYSLADILNLFTLKKDNAEEFPPIVDLYIEIENDKGEKIVVSWGEIYFSNSMDDIIIASGVSRIVPEKSKTLWPLPTESKMVFMDDLITARNISNPVKITVKSYKNDRIEIVKGKKPLYSPKVDINSNNKTLETLTENSKFPVQKSVHTIFYGKGRGLHGTEPFTGSSVKDVLSKHIDINTITLKNALIVVVADDGYRTVYSWSELCNRNDQADILLICNPELEHKGIFRFYPSCDFFTDRAINAISQIIIENN